MSSIWVYCARVYSRDRQFVVSYDAALTEAEYAEPMCREHAQREAEAQVQHMEGVATDMPIEGMWLEYKFREDNQAAGTPVS